VSKDECQAYIKAYFDRYPGVKNWIDVTAATLGYTGELQNTFGRYRRLPDSQSSERWKRGRAGRQGVNFLIQGDAADVFKHAAVRVAKFLDAEGARTKIVNFVHDEIQFYWHKDEFHLLSPVKELMEDFPQFCVPITVEIDVSKRDWASKRKVKLAH
jgi:DNA polymerase-1